MEWVAELDDQKQKFDANPTSAERLTETQRRAIDVGRRLMTYKAYSGDEMRSAGIVRVMPRPSSDKALGYMTKVIKKAREAKNLRDLAPIEFDTLKAIDTYWNDVPRDAAARPGRERQVRREVLGLAARELGLGAAQGPAEGQARGPGRGRLPRGRGEGVPGGLSRSRSRPRTAPGPGPRGVGLPPC